MKIRTVQIFLIGFGIGSIIIATAAKNATEATISVACMLGAIAFGVLRQ